jgi:transmembrane sensor
MPETDTQSSPSDPVEARAAHWLARRDRGLDSAEQAGYAKWLREDPRHAAAITRLEKVWSLLDRLAEQRPAGSAAPDPDALAPHRRRARWVWVPLLAAAAAVAFVYFGAAPGPALKIAGSPEARPNAARRAIIHPGPERLVLEDGSMVDLNAGAKVDVQFTPAERRVRLVQGEAFFTVVKNPERPFIVSADQITVRAVGTAFSVALDPEDVSVLVKEGKVKVGAVLPPSGEIPATPRELSALVAGQQCVVNLAAGGPDAARPEIKISDLTPAQIEHALLWQGLRLEFSDMKLGDIATEFNRYNQRKLIIGDAETAVIRFNGTFRADNVDAFVRLLDAFGVSAFPRGEEIVLRKTHDQ